MAKKRSQGGGSKKNTEPRVQVFQQWSGVNFQNSPRQFEQGSDVEEDQTNLQMNYMAVQNNVYVADDKSLKTRPSIRKVATPPSGKSFTKALTLFGNTVYAAFSDGSVGYGELGGTISGSVYLNDNNDTVDIYRWNDIDVANGQLVGMSTNNQIWTGAIEDHELECIPKGMLKPSAIVFNEIEAHGNLSVSEVNDEGHGFRIGVCFTYLTKFGPTLPSDGFYFYANKPTTEWNATDYLFLRGHVHSQYEQYLKGVELYYVEGNYQDWAFLTHLEFEVAPVSYEGWTYNWFGYSDVDNTALWTISNLTVPTENYSAGVPAQKVAEVDGRLYFYGSSQYPYRLWIGGNVGNEFSVSTGVGGGFIDVNPGSGEEIKKVVKYKTQSGNSIVSFLCSSANTTRERRYNLVENSISLTNENSIKGWQAEEVSGAVGTRSFEGCLVCEDGLYSVNRYGLALTTMTMEYNSQVKVNYVSQAIEPVFHDMLSSKMEDAVMININGIIYLSFADGTDEANLDKFIFCYDTGLKAWWTYSVDVPGSIISMIHIDSDEYQEGIGLVTSSGIWLLPTTIDDSLDTVPSNDFILETADLSTQMPVQGWQHITQIQFEFDHFVGDMQIEMIAIDQFGRKVTTTKTMSYDDVQYGLTEWMRIDLKVRQYKLRFTGRANFRMTHFMAKTYTLSSRVGIVYGFDTAQGDRSSNNIRRCFKNYNDVKEAIIP